jgi:hypothetical protein
VPRERSYIVPIGIKDVDSEFLRPSEVFAVRVDPELRRRN